jgi:hypothetical protein
MCLLGIAFGLFDDFPLLVLANREEFYSRPSASPRIVQPLGPGPAWLGGLDLLAGGTWLGANEAGIVVAITNRSKVNLPPAPPSRGQLCRQLLEQTDPQQAAQVATQALEANHYAGCNLLIAGRDQAYVIEAGDELKSTELPSGLHLLANGPLADPHDLRIARVAREFGEPGPESPAAWFAAARRICGLTGAGATPPICLTAPDRGTVSSTVLGIGRRLEDSHFWYAPAPPSSGQYDDYSPILCDLLLARHTARTSSASSIARTTGISPAAPPEGWNIEPPDNSPARRAARETPIGTSTPRTTSAGAGPEPYRILLRGPWQCEPQARCQLDRAGTRVWSLSGLPSAATVRLPAAWQDLFGEFRGRVIFRRKFHPPSNLEPATRLAIAFDGEGGHGSVALNGRFLGQLNPVSRRFEISGQLPLNCELEVELEFTDSNGPGVLAAPVALEIVEPG